MLPTQLYLTPAHRVGIYLESSAMPTSRRAFSMN